MRNASNLKSQFHFHIKNIWIFAGTQLYCSIFVNNQNKNQNCQIANNWWKISEFSRIILDFSKWQQKKSNPSWRMKSSSLLQIAKKVCVFGVVGYTFQDNFAQPWLLSESSMEPTYSDGDMVLMSSWNYSIKRGDVILLKAPLITKEAICKRVVGMWKMYKI